MFAKYYDEKNQKLCSCVVEPAPRWIGELFTGPQIPVVAGNKLMIATYEKEIDCLYLQGEISHETIMQKAVEEVYKRYQDAITTAYINNKDYVIAVYNELQKMNPPW